MIQITENNFQETKEKILNDTFELLKIIKIIQVLQEESIHKEKTIEHYDDYLIMDYKQRLHELVFNLSGIHLFAELAPKIPNEAIIIL